MFETRSYLSADLYLSPFPPSFLVRLVLGYWWEWREHCLVLGTWLLLPSWKADARINNSSERLVEISFSLAKISEKVESSHVTGRAALTLARIYHLAKIHEALQPGLWDLSVKIENANAVLCNCWAYVIPSGFEIWESLVIASTQPFVYKHDLCSTGLVGQSQWSEEQNWGRNVSRSFQNSRDCNAAVYGNFRISSIINS